MTEAERIVHETATNCRTCNQPFSATNIAQRHHNDVSGRYLFPVCQNCNLALKPRTCPNGHEVVCLFHSLKCYDSHFILKNFKREYSAFVSKKTGKTSYQDISCIPMNAEKNLQFKIRNVTFTDSYEFLGTSLEKLVEMLRKDGKSKFVETTTASQHYNLRPRRHTLQLSEHHTRLLDSNFFVRMLYKHCY